MPSEWSKLDFVKETQISLDSLNWPKGVSEELFQRLISETETKKLREVVLDQAFREWSGFRKSGYVLRDPGLIIATASYYAFFEAPMEETSRAINDEKYRFRAVKRANRMITKLKEKYGLKNPHSDTYEILQITVPLLKEDPRGFSVADFLLNRCVEEFGQNHPVSFGVNQAAKRYKELYSILVEAGASPDTD